ncbi:diacylglycerol/lipid kinase family protein [Adhaeribacter rhizoryzae]|uniref:Diacylglycerol kinase family lipid kinase n=1 Tax=Adhaeribacter rhizoryzae TaxID=2607907 RepID=A0A5M6DMR9_9BACT|nr:diacylglycerol kinase family protein [Adhaeribacter rhizoryzae]KAA5547440.1 diacylglycerol kinase family lipid kinase [Adhaeribacter rhizoryzae]
MRTQIKFIINPVSGRTKGGVDVPGLLNQLLDKERFEPEIVFTQYAGHATEIAREAAAEKIPIVCAVGGDGTVNEVARGLMGTQTALAILPKGSGNGLARHLGIPMNVSHAINILNQGQPSAIDTCTINNHPFFCTAGIGFDAHVSSVFAASTRRGLQTYVQMVLREFFNFKPQVAELALNGQKLKTSCFVVAFANASQYGNNAYIAPMADIRDGLVDVCLIRHLNLAKAIGISYGLITKQIATSPDAEYFKTQEILVKSEHAFKFHADGEYMGEATSFKVQIMPLTLHVIVPREEGLN